MFQQNHAAVLRHYDVFESVYQTKARTVEQASFERFEVETCGNEGDEETLFIKESALDREETRAKINIFSKRKI